MTSRPTDTDVPPPHSPMTQLSPAVHLPARRTRWMYWGARSTVRQMYRAWPLTARGVRALSLIEAGFGRLPRPANVDVEGQDLGGVPVEVSIPVAPAARVTDAAAVLYLHGGAFLFCGTATHRHICRDLAVGLGTPVYSVGYRQLPGAGIGTAIADAYTAYAALRTELGPSAPIVVAGDSAGGFLAAKICELAAADRTVGPAALIGYSPLLDLDMPLTDGPWPTRDALQPARTIRRAQALWNDDRGPITMRGTRAMRTGPLREFPPTFLTSAENEVIEEPILEFANRLAANGRSVEAHRWRRTVHAFPVLADATPESRAAIALTVDFLRMTLPRTPDTSPRTVVHTAD